MQPVIALNPRIFKANTTLIPVTLQMSLYVIQNCTFCGGGGDATPLVSVKLLDWFLNIKLHLIALHHMNFYIFQNFIYMLQMT